MARKSSSTIRQEELYPYAGNFPSVAREELDARLVDLDVDQESPFLRAQKRVSARRSSLPKKTAHRLLWGLFALATLGVSAAVALAVYHYGEHSWRFRIDSSDSIEVTGNENVSQAQIMEVMGSDIGRNIFFIPLAQQKAQLEQIPWVESASVMRFVPNHLKVEIQERTPVAFARVGPRIFLIDAGGTLMELPPKHKYSFPVILGMNPGEPLSTRIPRMKAYNQLVQQLDSDGGHYSEELSEIDISDLENVKVRVNDPQGDVLVELGSSNFLKRYKTYITHVQEWRQQFQQLESVNLRYDNQVIVNPDMEGKAKQAFPSAAAAKAGAATGVKPAVLVTHIDPHERSMVKPGFGSNDKKLEPKPAAVRKRRRFRGKKTSARRGKSAAKKAGRKHSSTVPKADAKKAAVVANTIPKPSPAVPKPSAGSN
jgi:cell division protein FtsQ